MRVRADQRSIEARREPEAMAAMASGAVRLRALLIELADAFATVDASAAFVFEGASSVLDHAMRIGYSPSDARLLRSLGSAFTASPELRERVLDGRVVPEAGAVIGRVLTRKETTPAEARAWVDRAATTSCRELRKKVRKRIEELERREAVVEVLVHVTGDDRDAFDVAREIASRKAGRALTDGETFSVVVRHYLDSNDVACRTPRPRRVGPTSERLGDRYVPAEVVRKVRERSGARCEVPGCPNRMFRQLAHITPHAEGSGREVEDLLDLCTTHHVLFDAGWIRLVPDGDAWQFVTADGALLGPWSPAVPAPTASPGANGGFADGVAEPSPPTWPRRGAAYKPRPPRPLLC